MPERIQLLRLKGWRMPANTVKVDRSTNWGNRFAVTACIDVGYADNIHDARRLCVGCFRDWLLKGDLSEWWNGCTEEERESWVWMRANLDTLFGKNLACWCPLDVPCHADVLLEIANQSPGQRARREPGIRVPGAPFPDA